MDDISLIHFATFSAFKRMYLIKLYRFNNKVNISIMQQIEKLALNYSVNNNDATIFEGKRVKDKTRAIPNRLCLCQLIFKSPWPKRNF